MSSVKKNLAQNIRQKVIDSYAAIAKDFDRTRKNPWADFEAFLPYIKKGAKVLDLGCGNGRLSEFLKQKDVTYLGVDNNSKFIEIAKKNFPEEKFMLGDMVKVDTDESFDNILCIAAYHHLPNKEDRVAAALEMHRLLKKDGVLILTVWNLFQPKYIFSVIKAALYSIITLGQKYAWNDTWIKWGNNPLKRYYHAFLPKELKKYFENDLWEIEDLYFTRKGNKVNLWASFNIVLIARKK